MFVRNNESRRGKDSAVGSPSRGDASPTRGRLGVNGTLGTSPFEVDLSIALEDGLLEGTTPNNNAGDSLCSLDVRANTPGSHTEPLAPQGLHTEAEPLGYPPDNLDSCSPDEASSTADLERLKYSSAGPPVRTSHFMGESSKGTRDLYEDAEEKDLLDALKKQGAVTAMLYHNVTPDPEANDIWPNFRNAGKLPVCYSILDVNRDMSDENSSNRRPKRATQNKHDIQQQTSLRHAQPQNPSSLHTSVDETKLHSVNTPCKGRPVWQLPVELVEQIIEYLNRDDVKSLRLVSRELNDYTSQAAFKTVVVPFNTEIYGMLGKEPGPDRKGKKRAKISRPDYWWKNANDDGVYNGHGLDVFRGFGRHILRYGMSFEVSEDSLSAPPLKLVTEQKTSFWGDYEWPFEEYRRFDAVAGLESAADETPRMTTAFSELTKVKELALSVDSGLGWLNGPDRSIRARILRKLPNVFGSRQRIPDRRTQAQYELWDHIENMHAVARGDVRTASLYRLEGTRALMGAQEASLLATAQPRLPFLDSHIIHEATPHDVTESTMTQSFEDLEVLESCMLGPPLANAGVLFTSTILQHNDCSHVTNPIVPATLTKAQKEWLLETEWAQRAFVSSYMLSIIDNPATFYSIHTLNVSSLSDRYIPMLNRADFWTALPTLTNFTLMVIPDWRTVQKDEAGFVDTPRVDPTARIDTFCELLRTQVALRPNIKKLKVGFTTGGEHAEGLHARNKLLMPAPLLPLTTRMHTDTTFALEQTATVQDANVLQQALLRFPYLEELTLSNCWITPSALLQFIRVHDVYSLTHLELDSVSLTAVLRTNGNAQPPQAGQQPVPQNAAVPPQHMAGVLWYLHNNNIIGGNAAPGHHIPANGHLLNLFIQSLMVQLQQLQAHHGGVLHQNHITAVQNQLQEQLQNAQAPDVQQHQGLTLPLAHNLGQQSAQVHQHMNFAQITHIGHIALQVNMMQQQIIAGQAAPGLSTNPPIGDNNSVLHMRPREGSWINIIDQISPGNNLSDFESPHSQANPKRITSLSSIRFKSCGYAKLPNLTGVDQSGIVAENGLVDALRNPAFAKRYNALAPAMLSSKWPYLGEIVQEVDSNEFAALNAGWNLRHGWEDSEAAKAAEFDGLLSGGTGRFSGRVQRSDKLSTKAEPAS